MQNYTKRTQVGTALLKRQQKAILKTQKQMAEPVEFRKPRFSGRQQVPSSVNIMPIVNVNVNLNLSSTGNS